MHKTLHKRKYPKEQNLLEKYAKANWTSGQCTE